MRPKFSIVIPTYKHLSDCLIPCIESIKTHTDLSNVEVLVVANGCGDDGTREYIHSLGEPFKLIWLDEPSGYTHSTNVGIEAASGDYIILLNNDTVILGGEWISLLYEPFKRDPLMGITGPLMLHCPDADRDFLVFFCAMISREMIDSIGALDEVFSPGYGEDCDLAARAIDTGWKIQQVPPSIPQLVDKGCEDLPQWKRDKMWHNPFPIYHDGNKTFGDQPLVFDEVLRRNKQTLQERYGSKKVNTPSGLCPKCNGQLIDGTCVGEEGKLNCDGLYIWRAAQIDGWFGVDEGAWIARQVKSLPMGAKILEVGSWHGRSSRFIADNLPEAAQVFCVDTFNGSSDEPEMHGTAHYDSGDHAHQWWWCNLHEHILQGRVVPTRMHSANAAHTLKHLGMKFDLIFIDGDHSEEGIKTDVEAWLPVLKQGGLICGHDYYKEHEGPHWVHVRQYIEAKFPDVEKTATSIWYTRPKVKRTVIDCVPFNDELLLLEARFSELDPVVDRFVIVEATKSHSGNDKPLYFKDNLDRFQPWLNKVTHIVVDEFPVEGLSGSDLHWAIERHQRDSIMRGLTECNDDDVIIISDTDEIPTAESITRYDPSKGICCLEMKLYYGSMNCEGVEPWRWTRMLPYGLLKQNSPCWARYVPNYQKDQVIKDAGWHFSFMGGPDEWVRKLESTPHQEYNKPEFKDKTVMLDRVTNGRDLLGRDIPYRLVEVDESFPKFVVENLQRFKDNQFILEDDMHPESFQFVEMVKSEYPDFFRNKKVLEVGSLDINGSVRQFFENCDYEGIDIAEGPGVDRVVLAHQFLRPDVYDVVISSEMLEHDRYWFTSLKQMYKNLKPGGLFVLSCAGPKRPEHGTTKTDTYSSPFTTDYYRNISKEDFLNALPNDLFNECTIGYDRGEEDLHFWGVKKGAAFHQYQEAMLETFNQLTSQATDFKPPTLATKKHWTVTAEISTKDRYFTTLPLTISAVANQTRKVDKLVIYDDGEQLDLRMLSPFEGLLKMLDELKIKWEIVRTPREGQVANHQHCLATADTDFIWRVDDDEIPAPDCLNVLLNTIRDYGDGGQFDSIGAIAGLVHHPGAVSPLPEFVDGTLKDVQAGLNMQWFDFNSYPREVEHLYSTFLYRVEAGRKAGGYPRALSAIGHREETIFSHSIKRAGYKLIVTPYARTWHLREQTGGIRSFSDQSLWERDENVFRGYLKEWGYDRPVPTKVIVLDCGIGDHFAFLSVLPKIKEAHPDKDLVLAVCYPSVFDGQDLKLISIADAKNMLGDRYDDYSIYKHLWDRNWDSSLSDGMLAMHG